MPRSGTRTTGMRRQNAAARLVSGEEWAARVVHRDHSVTRSVVAQSLATF